MTQQELEAYDAMMADRDRWKAAHDNQVALKRIIVARPDLAERAPLVEKLMLEKRQAEMLNVAFHMRIRKLESVIRKMDAAHGILPENARPLATPPITPQDDAQE